MEIAASDARDWLLSGIQLRYSKEQIRSTYRSSVEKLFRYALTKPTVSTKNLNLSPLERLEKIDQDTLFSYSTRKEIPDEYYGLVLDEAKRQVAALGENAPLSVGVFDRPGMLQDMERLIEKIANEIDNRYKKAPPHSVESMIVNEAEIEAMVKDAVKGDSRYDDSARSILTTKIRHEIRRRGYL